MTERWTCGHEAGAMCAQCYSDLAARANELAEEVERLRGQIDDMRAMVRDHIAEAVAREAAQQRREEGK